MHTINCTRLHLGGLPARHNGSVDVNGPTSGHIDFTTPVAMSGASDTSATTVKQVVVDTSDGNKVGLKDVGSADLTTLTNSVATNTANIATNTGSILSNTNALATLNLNAVTINSGIQSIAGAKTFTDATTCDAGLSVGGDIIHQTSANASLGNTQINGTATTNSSLTCNGGIALGSSTVDVTRTGVSYGVFAQLATLSAAPTWVALTPETGFEGANAQQLGFGYRQLEIMKDVTGRVELRGHVYATNSSTLAQGTGVDIMTIPSAYRPTKHVYCTVVSNGANDTSECRSWPMRILSGGTATVYVDSDTTSQYLVYFDGIFWYTD